MVEEANHFRSTHVPKFDRDYDHWHMVMKNIIQSKECWNVVDDGYEEIKPGEQATATQRKNYEENKLKDLKVLNYLFQDDMIDVKIVEKSVEVVEEEGSRMVENEVEDEVENLMRMRRATVDGDHKNDQVLMAGSETERKGNGRIWLLESACSNHMTGNKTWFTTLDTSFTHSVKLENDKRPEVQGIGDMKFKVNGLIQVITKVYFALDLTSSKISVGQLQEKGLTFIFKESVGKVYHPIQGLILTSNMTKNSMFPVLVEPIQLAECMQVVSGKDLWHKRFAHVSHKSFRTMQFNGMVEGLPKVAEKTKVCEVCAMEKHIRMEIPKKSNWHATDRLQLVHIDICGPISPSSQSNKSSFEHIADGGETNEDIPSVPRQSDGQGENLLKSVWNNEHVYVCMSMYRRNYKQSAMIGIIPTPPVQQQWLLSTWDQTFGLGVADEELFLYRLRSERCVIVVAGEHREKLG
ncbi:hypothetical protein E3N88_42048 [Mikania micrantha]|uniref:Uncharacterized protein n=1 Tax=Mikania micrantha TaxID=192012 RepID=A0A5N6LIV2_9ASTR|nr:hypothetical protein E3N88_42048 [Mikania micrantha]